MQFEVNCYSPPCLLGINTIVQNFQTQINKRGTSQVSISGICFDRLGSGYGTSIDCSYMNIVDGCTVTIEGLVGKGKK